MRYLGRIIGVFICFLLMGPLGIIVGFYLGYQIDKMRLINMTSESFYENKEQQHTACQACFFTTTFETMGHLSKAKGRITEIDIQLASEFMDRLSLYGEAREKAKRSFGLGKQADYPLEMKLQHFQQVCGKRSDLLNMFLEIQIQMAFSDGQLHPEERRILYTIAACFGISRIHFDNYLRMMEGAQHFNESTQESNSGPFQQQHAQNKLANAYRVLGVSEKEDSKVIKRAYRKLMNEHHPDKLVAKGLPTEMISMAKEKTQQIQAAYDLIKKTKGFK